MPTPTTRELLHRLAGAFTVAFAALTAAMLALYARNQVPALSARGAPTGTILEAVLLGIPFVAAMTIPMAVFVAVLVAVLRDFTRLGADGTLASARRDPDGVRRLVAPVIGASAASGSGRAPRRHPAARAIWRRLGDG